MLDSFTPAQHELLLRGADGDRTEAVRNVAWIAFTSGDDDGPPDDGLERFRVHVAGGRTLVVRARPDDVKSETGFFAWPEEDDETELFVFAHAVNACERDLPLGEMLVAEGLLDAAGLQRGLAAQSGARRVPIAQLLVEPHQAAATDRARPIPARARLGDVLVEGGFASVADVELAMAEQRRRQGKRLGEVLVDMGILSEIDLARALSAKFQLPFVDLDAVEINAAAFTEVPRDVVARYGVLPLDVDAKVLTVAIADPLSTDAIDMLRFQSRRRVRVVLVTHTQLERAVRDALDAPRPANARVDGARAPHAHVALAFVDVGRDADVIKLVNQLLVGAAQRGASDVHIEPHGDDEPVRIRLRVDGRCLSAPDLPGRLRSALVARIKVMANLDMAERRRPQDGKLTVPTPDGASIDVRVATIPTIDDNEDVVLRILGGTRPLAFDDLLLSDENAAAARSWMDLDHGLVLCVGPTGCGKTTTVHALLGTLDTRELKVWTAEDPVEIVAPGMRQVHVQPKIDLTFAAALRAFLRADPDVIMVGEMRDRETASLAVEASLTGHLVLSTLHTKSAPDTIARVLEMGVEPFAVADALTGVLSQRLVRRLCDRCKTSAPASGEEIAALERTFGSDVVARAAARGPISMWQPGACDACGRSGYRGRIALHEALTVDDRLRPLVARRATADELRAAVGADRRTLREDGLMKALAGVTDLREVLAAS